jgi:hypothetical protein
MPLLRAVARLKLFHLGAVAAAATALTGSLAGTDATLAAATAGAAAGGAGAMTWLQYRGVRESATFNNAVVIVKVAVLLLFLVSCWGSTKAANWTVDEVVGTPNGATILKWSKDGYNAGALPGNQQPRSHFPLGVCVHTLRVSHRRSLVARSCWPTCRAEACCGGLRQAAPFLSPMTSRLAPLAA